MDISYLSKFVESEIVSACEGEYCLRTVTGKSSLEILRLSTYADIEQIYERCLQLATPYHPQNGGQDQESDWEFRVLIHSTYRALIIKYGIFCKHKQCKQVGDLITHFTCLEMCLTKERHQGHCNELFYFEILETVCNYQRSLSRKDKKKYPYSFLTHEELNDLVNFYDALKEIKDKGCETCKPSKSKNKDKGCETCKPSKSKNKKCEPKVERKARTKAKAKKTIMLDKETMEALRKKIDKLEEKPQTLAIRCNRRVLDKEAEEEIERQKQKAISEKNELEQRLQAEKALKIRDRKKRKKAMKKGKIPVSEMTVTSSSDTDKEPDGGEVGKDVQEVAQTLSEDETPPRYQPIPCEPATMDPEKSKELEEKLKQRTINPIELGRRLNQNLTEIVSDEDCDGDTFIPTIVCDKNSINISPNVSKMSFAGIVRKKAGVTNSQSADEIILDDEYMPLPAEASSKERRKTKEVGKDQRSKMSCEKHPGKGQNTDQTYPEKAVKQSAACELSRHELSNFSAQNSPYKTLIKYQILHLQ